MLSIVSDTVLVLLLNLDMFHSTGARIVVTTRRFCLDYFACSVKTFLFSSRVITLLNCQWLSCFYIKRQLEFFVLGYCSNSVTTKKNRKLRVARYNWGHFHTVTFLITTMIFKFILCAVCYTVLCVRKYIAFKITESEQSLTIFEICALLGCYAALSGNYLPTFRGNVSFLSSRVKKSNEAVLYRTCWPLKMRLNRCPETSVKDYHLTLYNTVEERRSHQNRGGSLKSSLKIFLQKRHLVCTCSPSKSVIYV
jgi:hypothetical protein